MSIDAPITYYVIIAYYLIKALASASVKPSANNFAIPLALASAAASAAAVRSACSAANATAAERTENITITFKDFDNNNLIIDIPIIQEA